MRSLMPGTGPLTRLFGALAGVVLLVIGAMFSLVVLALALAVGLAVWGWFWWKTRALRRQIDGQMSKNAARTSPSPRGEVFEGEAVVVEEELTRVISNRSTASPDHH